MTSVPTNIERFVRERPDGRCDYCGMHQSIQGGTFHCEHILPRVLGCQTVAENMALACPSCNLHKSRRVAVRDAETGSVIPHFNPRTDRWAEHFEWDEFTLAGISPTGRATIDLLQLNAPRRLQIRQAERLFDLFPPDW